MWVTKLLISPVKKRIFCPKTTKFSLKLAFLSIAGSFEALLVGWLILTFNFDFWSDAVSTADCCVPGNLAYNLCWKLFRYVDKQCSETTLVGGSGPYEGNILVGGLPVCDDHHNANNALVVCRSCKHKLIMF